MDGGRLERAVELGRKLDRFLIAVNGPQGFPYITSARGIEKTAEDRLAVEEWFCPVTARHMESRPGMAVLVWDPASGEGCEILGRVLSIEERDYMNGYAPEAGAEKNIPQARRRVSIRVETILDFGQGLRCEDIGSQPGPQSADRAGEEPSLPYCGYAPEWAEHARFDRAEEPCDDGRTGNSEPCPGGEDECVTGAP